MTTKSAPRVLTVLQTGDPVPEVRETRGRFTELIVETLAATWKGEWTTVDVRDLDAKMPDPAGSAAFVITGSSHSVTERAPWMLRTEEWIRSAHAQHANLFGICFGHQIIGQALGGLVAKNPNGREIGKVTVEKLADDAMFFTLPERFAVHATHVDSVVTLPPGAKLLARTSLEPHAAYAIGETVRCVQYHPEMDADVMRKYIAARWNGILADGLDAEAIRAGIGEAPDNSVALTNFVKNLVTSGV
ncbi:MAG TPA: glutamine amidotransferase [Polyangiaceae bacterium]